MKLQFKVQQYQTDAVDAVVECFAGQPKLDVVSYRIDPGRASRPRQMAMGSEPEAGFRNAEIALTPAQLLANIQDVQRRANLPQSPVLARSQAATAPNTPNLDIEMETGTGKTYVYIKTIMELHKRYGWSKFIVVVPSVAIREGVKTSFDITAEHFQQAYGTKPRAFVYNSSQLHELESFSSGAGVQVMIINIQAFNATGKDNRRIYEELDDFQSRKPIDVISANRPIVILDEPQKIGAPKSLEALSKFKALMVLRYSATHKVEHNKVHRFDALDAYNQKLVKKIAVRGITVKGLAGSTAYLYLDSIEVAKGAKPRARVELEVQTKTGIKRLRKRLDVGSRLHDISNGLEACRELVITDIDAIRDVVELSNGDVITSGQVTADVTDEAKRRIQIRDVIRAHIDKERELFAQGVKVLSLFFIDQVAKYRDYAREDTLGDYARIFVEEYQAQVAEELATLALDPEAAAYREHLTAIAVEATHQGYFSIDKKSNRLVDGKISGRGDDKGQSTDVSAYDLILKDKERLLSFTEPVRFIFSHSALREGWDNPNVFVMGMLKKSDNAVSRRQEIGRGLRLSVDQRGERMDNPVTVHDINELTVVTDESYTDFVAGLQREISESLASRPRKASVKYFYGKTIVTEAGDVVVDEQVAIALYKYLVKNDYVNEDDTISDAYRAARDAGTPVEPTSEALKPMVEFLWPLVDALCLDVDFAVDGRKSKRNPINEKNFAKKEFKELWERINHKAIYQVEFDSEELIGKCVTALDKHLTVAPMPYVVQSGVLRGDLDADDVRGGVGFKAGAHRTEASAVSASSQVRYDLLGEVAEKTKLTRRTVGAILTRMAAVTFARYKQDFTKAGGKLDKHIYDYVVTDSQVERDFVAQLDTSSEVIVYAKRPRGFFIPTPVGDYNPDWAIAFQEGTVKHIYFVAETKGSLATLQLRGVEDAKIECARKFFDELNRRHGNAVTYDVVTDYTDLMALVGVGA